MIIENKTKGKAEMLFGKFLMWVGVFALFTGAVDAFLGCLALGYLCYLGGSIMRWYYND